MIPYDDIEDKTSTYAYEAGYAAFDRGGGIQPLNPFSVQLAPVQHQLWEDGWNAAEQAACDASFEDGEIGYDQET